MRRGFMLSGIKVVGPGPVSKFEMDVETKTESTPETKSEPTPTPETKPEPTPTPPTPEPELTAWAKYLNSESIVQMIWAVGEISCRENDFTLAKLKNHWSRVAASFYALVLLGKQGNITHDQYFSMYGPTQHSMGPLPELYKELPQPAGRQQTIRGLDDLKALFTDKLFKEMSMGKYSAWFIHENRLHETLDILLVLIWCIGGLVATPLGEELTPAQKEYMDIITHSTRRGFDRKQTVDDAKVKAHADFAKSYPTAP